MVASLEMRTVKPKPDLTAVKDDPILELFQREYAMLQDKIDKIGGFRFTIKGWALTLSTGALVAAFATSLEPLVAIFLISGLLFGLWSLEWRQAKLTDLFQSRTLRLETRILRRLNSLGVHRLEFATLICSPGIANELRTPVEVHRPDKAATSALRRRRGMARRISNFPLFVMFRRSKIRRKLIGSDFFFYLLLWLVSAVFVLFQHHQMSHNPSSPGVRHFFRIAAMHGEGANYLQGKSWPDAGK